MVKMVACTRNSTYYIFLHTICRESFGHSLDTLQTNVRIQKISTNDIGTLCHSLNQILKLSEMSMSTRYLKCNSNVANISGTKFSIRVAVVAVTVLTVALIVIITVVAIFCHLILFCLLKYICQTCGKCSSFEPSRFQSSIAYHPTMTLSWMWDFGLWDMGSFPDGYLIVHPPDVLLKTHSWGWKS